MSSLVHALLKRVPARYFACSVYIWVPCYSLIYQTYTPNYTPHINKATIKRIHATNAAIALGNGMHREVQVVTSIIDSDTSEV